MNKLDYGLTPADGTYVNMSDCCVRSCLITVSNRTQLAAAAPVEPPIPLVVATSGAPSMAPHRLLPLPNASYQAKQFLVSCKLGTSNGGAVLLSWWANVATIELATDALSRSNIIGLSYLPCPYEAIDCNSEDIL